MTQQEQIKKHLLRHRSITSIQAFSKYGCTRLSAVIFRLKAELPINTDMIEVKTRYGKTTVAKYILK